MYEQVSLGRTSPNKISRNVYSPRRRIVDGTFGILLRIIVVFGARTRNDGRVGMQGPGSRSNLSKIDGIGYHSHVGQGDVQGRRMMLEGGSDIVIQERRKSK